jgi:hypothetical protein
MWCVKNAHSDSPRRRLKNQADAADNFIGIRNLAGDPGLHIVDQQGGFVGRNDLFQRSRYGETLELQHAYSFRLITARPATNQGVG